MTNKKQNKKPVIYWILQENQITPFIIDFLELIRFRTTELIKLKFLIPAISPETLKMCKKLDPVPFQVTTTAKENSYEGYCRKRDQLGDSQFSEGLSFWRTLLLDDLGSGNLYQAQIHAPKNEKVAGVVLQIPTPLGSSENEERIFYAWVHLAKINKVPVIGYELLPLCTRWTLAPSILDNIIATREESFSILTDSQTRLNKKIWLLPRHEGKFFSPATTALWRNGMGAFYKYQNKFKIPPEKTILYIPHNVAMTYEYKTLLTHLKKIKTKIHLMFSIGKDQIRGSHNHQEIIETVCEKELKTISYSMHDINNPAEITMADAVVACSACYATEVAANNGIPSFIHDPMVTPYKNGNTTSVNKVADLIELIESAIELHNKTTEISQILLNLIQKKVFSKGVKNG